MSFSEIQEQTLDNPASLSRYLQTLRAKNYIHKNLNQNYVAIEKFIAPNNMGMMSKNSVHANDISSIWSNHFYQKNIDEKVKAFEDSQLNNEEKSFFEKNLKEFAGNIKEKGYMCYRVVEQHIIRFGFPIHYKGHVIATIGVGTFINQVSEENVEKVQVKQELMDKGKEIKVLKNRLPFAWSNLYTYQLLHATLIY